MRPYCDIEIAAYMDKRESISGDEYWLPLLDKTAIVNPLEGAAC